MRNVSVVSLLVYLLASSLFGNDLQQQLNLIQNNDGEIIYLHLKGNEEVTRLLDNIDEVQPLLNLETLIVEGYGYRKKAEEINLARFIEFLQNNGRNLKNLYIIGKPAKRSTLSQEELAQIVQALQDFNIEDFRWEYQRKIKDKKGPVQLADSNKFWYGLKHLSFEGTAFNKKTMFFCELPFDSLKSLNLSKTEINTKMLNVLTKYTHNFPVLEKLDMSEHKIRLKGKFKEKNSFKNLKSLQMFSLKARSKKFNKYEQQSRILRLLKSNPDFFEHLKEFYIYNRYTSSKFLGNKKLSNQKIKAKDNAFTFTPNIRRTGYFFRAYDESKIPEIFLKNIGTSEWFFASRKDIDMCLENYPHSDFETVTLATSQITKWDMEYLVNLTIFKSLKHIYLVHTGIDFNEMGLLRTRLSLNDIKIHVVNNSDLTKPDKPFYGPFPFEHQFPKPDIPKINIPRR